MKNMQEFHRWLSSNGDANDLPRRRLAAIAHLDRSRLVKATGELSWFIWEAEQVPAA